MWAIWNSFLGILLRYTGWKSNYQNSHSGLWRFSIFCCLKLLDLVCKELNYHKPCETDTNTWFCVSFDITWCLLCPPVQTIFIIAVCNNQLLDWIENELIWILSFVPGFSSVLPGVIAKLNAVKAKYLKAPSHAMTANPKVTLGKIYQFVCLSLSA